MRFEKEMQRIAFELEVKHRFNVLQCVYGLKKSELTPADLDILEEAHLKRIDLSDAIYVVDIGGHIGSMTRELYFTLNMFYKQMNANLCRGFGMCPAIKNLSRCRG